MVVSSLLPQKSSHRGIYFSRTAWRTYKNPASLSDISTCNPIEQKILSRIYSLGEKIKRFEDIERVRIFAPRNWDLHWIEFEIEAKGDAFLSKDLWDKLQDLVIDLEWQLRDETSESWNFHLSEVSSLASLEAGARLLWVSYLSSTPSSQNIQSSFTQFKHAM